MAIPQESDRLTGDELNSLGHGRNAPGRNMRIVVASEDRSTRAAIGMLIQSQPDFELAGDAADLTDLLARVKSSQPNLVILDWESLGQRIEALLDLLELFEHPPAIIGLSIREQDRGAALAAGIAGFAYKGEAPERLLKTIRETHAEGSR